MIYKDPKNAQPSGARRPHISQRHAQCCVVFGDASDEGASSIATRKIVHPEVLCQPQAEPHWDGVDQARRGRGFD